MEAIERGEIKAVRETFGEFWARYLEERRPYVTPGTLIDYESHGRKRLLPTFGSMPLVRIDEAAVRRWMRALTTDTQAAGLSRKTVNNARTILTVALNDAVRQGLIPRNPCLGVPALPVERQELEHLRLHEIAPYLDACARYYRSLAEPSAASRRRDKPILLTTLICGAAGVAGHAVLWLGAALGWDDNTVFWQPVVGMALVAVAVAAFGGFYLAWERARIAIAASFLLTFLVTLTYIVTIQAFADAAAEGVAGDLFVDLRTVVITIVGFYFGTEAIISVAKIVRMPVAQSGEALTDADRDLAR